MKKAIPAVSFGTSHADAEETCIRPVEDALRAAFPDREVRRARTSRMIIRKLRESGAQTDSETEGIERLRREGYGEIAVAATHIIPGREYEAAVRAAQGLPVSGPLLAEDADLAWMADLLGGIAREEGRPLLMMGHGTDRGADSVYARLRERLPEGVYLACVEGAHRLDTAPDGLRRLPAPARRVPGKETGA